MTVSNETNSAQYTAAGNAEEIFPTVFTFYDSSDVYVLADGTLQVEGSNYNVFGGNGATGSVRWVGKPTNGHTIDVIRRRPGTQLQDYLENDGFPAEAHEDTVDKLAMSINARLALSTADPRQWDAASKKITNLTTPTAATDAATKAYVDGVSTPTITMPTPANPGDDGKYLKADSGAYALDTLPFAPSDDPVGGDTGRVLTATGAGTFNWQTVPSTAPAPKNLIINPYGEVAQRMGMTSVMTAAGTLYPNDDANYAWDRWVLLSDGDDTVDVNREVGIIPPGSPSSMKFLVATANQKFGMAQFLTYSDSLRLHQDIASKTATLQFKAYTPTANALSNLRCAVLAWTGALDSPTRDVVDGTNWGAAGVNPTWAASYTAQGNSSNLALVVDTWTQFTLTVTLAQGATTGNLVVVIWVDDDNAGTGDIVYISDVQIEEGSTAQALERRSFFSELLTCQQFFIWTGGANLVPNDPLVADAHALQTYGASTTGDWVIEWYLPVTMWRPPGQGKVTIINPGAGVANNARNLTDSTDTPVTATHLGYSRVNFAPTIDVTDVDDQMAVAYVIENELGY